MSDSISSDVDPNIRVLLRIRPLNSRELHQSSSSILQFESADNEATVHIVDGSGYGSGVESHAAAPNGGGKSFTYDAVYGPDSTQVEVYDGVQGIVDAVCEGYNGTIVAYGQTGSGKTHTIFGQEGVQDNAQSGLVQRSLKAIYHKIAESQLSTLADDTPTTTIRTTTKASFLEIYNERIYDLLSPNLDDALLVREDGTKGVYVENLSERIVNNTSEAMEVLKSGMDNRKVASTNMNRVSSRSHALFVLNVKTEINQGGISKVRYAKFTLVDLAGSERQKNTETAGERLKEASMINNSLLCLGQVINSLVDVQRGIIKHAPFRDSKLTFLLKNSFGGNSKTCLVATVTPSVQSLTETISTLKFAQRAKLIKNNAVLNEDTCANVAALQAEVARLKSELAMRNDGTTGRASTPSPGRLPPLAPRQQNPVDPTDNATLMALRNQNSKLSKKLTSLKEITNQRETQVTSLKRKLQQETLIRKCKERRITYLSSKSDTSQEIASLQEEINALRDQLENGRNTEAIDYMIKYQEVKARVEEMESENEALEAIRHQDELESTCVSLMNEKDVLQSKLDTMSSDQNGELDAILADVTKLEQDNRNLQVALDGKAMQALQDEEKIRGHEVLLEELKGSLEAAQTELSAEKSKSSELQESIEGMKKEVEEKTASINEYENKVSAAQDEVKQLNETYAESTSTLQNKITELKKDVNLVMDENDSLINKMKDANDEITAKQDQLETLQREKEEALKQISLSSDKESEYLESYKLKEEEFQSEIEELHEKVQSLVSEKTDAITKLENMSAENEKLLVELESFKSENVKLYEQLTEMETMRDVVASLEDEMVLATEERDVIEEQLDLAKNDLDRALRFLDESTTNMTRDHNNDLASRDELIQALMHDKSVLQQELSGVSEQSSETAKEHEEKIEMLKNEIANMKNECDATANNKEAVSNELENAKEEHAKLVAYMEDHDKESADKISSLEAEKEGLIKELNAARLSLSESEGTSADLAKSTKKVEDLEIVIEKLQADLDELTEESASLKAKAASDGEAKSEVLMLLESEKAKLLSEIDELKTNEASTNEEVSALKEKITTVEEEYEAFKEKSSLSQEQFKAEILELQAEKQRLESECASVKNSETATADEVLSLMGKLEELEKDYASLKEESAKNAEQAKSDLLEMETEMEQLKSDCDTMKSKEASAKEEIEVLNTKVLDLEKEYESLKEVSMTSGELAKAELVELRSEKEHLESECASLKTNEASTNNEFASLKEKFEALEQKYSSLKEELSSSEEQVNSELLELRTEKERLESECNSLKESETSTKDELSSLKETLSALNTEYSSFKKESASIRDQAHSEFIELQAEKEQLESDYNAMKSIEVSKTEEVALLKEKKLTLEKDYQSLKDSSAASNEYAKQEVLELKAENERLQTECLTMKSNEASNNEEVTSLKNKLAALEKELESLNEESADKFDPNAVQHQNTNADEEEENPVNNTFMDDSFDEDMFLPNMGTPAKEEPIAPIHSPARSTKVEEANENEMPNKTPSSSKMTPSKDKPPVKKATTVKKNKRSTRSSKSQPKMSSPPSKRVTRSRASRTPLADINV